MLKEIIVKEISGRNASTIDFVFDPNFDWNIDLFLTHGASRLELAKKMPPTKILLNCNVDNDEQDTSQSLILPDLGHISPGGMILSQKAVNRLGPFWLEFGELLPLDVEGVEYYYYNVTNILENIVDVENSLRNRRGRLETPAFFADKMPSELAIFKVPERKCINLYISGSGFSKLMQEHDLKIGVCIRQVWSKENGSLSPIRVLDGYTGP